MDPFMPVGPNKITKNGDIEEYVSHTIRTGKDEVRRCTQSFALLNEVFTLQTSFFYLGTSRGKWDSITVRKDKERFKWGFFPQLGQSTIMTPWS